MIATSLILSWCFLFIPSDCANVLLLPLNINSHYGFFGRIGQALLDNHNHDVTMLVASNARLPSWLKETKVTLERYPVPHQVPWYSTKDNARLHLAYALAKSKHERQSVWDEMVTQEARFWTDDCVGLMEDHDLFDRMNNSRFDLVITDGTWPGCTYAYPYKLSVPHASFSLPLFMLMYRVPTMPSVYPSITSYSSEKMTFAERFFNVLDYITENTPEDDDLFVRKYVPERPVVSQQSLAQQSVFWFYLHDMVFDYPRPSMPNTVDIGDIVARPSNPLPGDLEDFVSGATNGVILMSFGSWFDDLPPEISNKFFEAFARINQRVIWKYQGRPTVDVPRNVKLMKWMPQNDLLGHPQVKLFISHCGLNSLMETIYHAVPVVGFPITIDQPRNAKVAESRGYAIVMNIADFTATGLVHNIKKVLEERSYNENAQRLSTIFRDKPESGSERVSYWVNHVINYGDAHLRTHAHDMPLYQYLMLDILVVVLLTLTALVVVSIVILILIYKKCFKNVDKGKHKQS